MKPLLGPILLVEDDPDIRDALETFLQAHQVPVRTARDGKEALELLAREPGVSLLLLDMALPVMDGHRLLSTRKTSDVLRALPVVIVSAGMAVMSPRSMMVNLVPNSASKPPIMVGRKKPSA